MALDPNAKKKKANPLSAISPDDLAQAAVPQTTAAVGSVINGVGQARQSAEQGRYGLAAGQIARAGASAAAAAPLAAIETATLNARALYQGGKAIANPLAQAGDAYRAWHNGAVETAKAHAGEFAAGLSGSDPDAKPAKADPKAVLAQIKAAPVIPTPGPATLPGDRPGLADIAKKAPALAPIQKPGDAIAGMLPAPAQPPAQPAPAAGDPFELKPPARPALAQPAAGAQPSSDYSSNPNIKVGAPGESLPMNRLASIGGSYLSTTGPTAQPSRYRALSGDMTPSEWAAARGANRAERLDRQQDSAEAASTVANQIALARLSREERRDQRDLANAPLELEERQARIAAAKADTERNTRLSRVYERQADAKDNSNELRAQVEFDKSYQSAASKAAEEGRPYTREMHINALDEDSRSRFGKKKVAFPKPSAEDIAILRGITDPKQQARYRLVFAEQYGEDGADKYFPK